VHVKSLRLLWVAGVSALAAVCLLATSAHTQTNKPQQPQGPIGTKPSTSACLTPEQQLELEKMRAEFELKNKQLNTLGQKIKEEKNDLAEMQKTVAHLADLVNGKAQITQAEKDAQVDPVDDKAYEEGLVREITLKIASDEQDLQRLEAELRDANVKITALAKLEKCPEPPKTAGGTDRPSTTTPPPGKPPTAGNQCRGATDAELLKEYRRLVAFYEKEIRETQGQIDKYEIDIGATGHMTGIDPALKQARIEEFKLQQATLKKRIEADQEVLEKFRALIKAILDKKPCPDETKTSSPNPPKTPHLTSKTERGRKATKKKVSKKTPSTTARRESPNAPQMNIGIGFGGSGGNSYRGGESYRGGGADRGGGAMQSR
jgi:hypothetical protein